MNDMMKWLPYYYRRSALTKEIYDVIQKGIDKVKSDISEQDKNLFIVTTDNFDLYEKDVGITPNESTDSEIRRSNVIAKIRGSNVLTVEELKLLVLAYEPSGVEVIENYPDYIVVLNFAHCEGQPSNINEILAAIEEVKPAHIQIGTNYARNSTSDINIPCVVCVSKNIELTLSSSGAILTYSDSLAGDNIWLVMQKNANAALAISDSFVISNISQTPLSVIQVSDKVNMELSQCIPGGYIAECVLLEDYTASPEYSNGKIKVNNVYMPEWTL